MIDRQLDQRIKAWIEEHQEELLGQWMDLIRIPSVRGERAPGAPFGVNSLKAMNVASSYFEKAGFNVWAEEENHYALAEWGTGKKTIGLFGHCDVVPVDNGWKYTQPFEPVIIDGYLIGRGSSDDKAGVMASLAAMRIINELNLPFKSRLQAYIGPGEESGMEDMVLFVKKEEMPALSLVPDSSFPCCLGERSILRGLMECKTPLNDILDFYGGKTVNVVLNEVTVVLRAAEGLAEELKALAGGKEEYALSLEQDKIVLKAFGTARHAGYPEGSVNATKLAAELLAQSRCLNSQDRACMEQLAFWLNDYYGINIGIAHEDPDFGKLSSANGIVKMQEGRISFTLDIRFGVSRDHLQTEAELAQFFEAAGWSFTCLNNRKGFIADKNSPIPETFTNIYHELTGSKAMPYYMSGGTYSRHLKNAFTVGTSAYIAEPKALCPPMPAGHGGAHQRDEAISIEGHFEAVRILVHYLLACDRYLND